MKYDKSIGNVNIKLDPSRFYNNLRNAQKLLNMQVAADCDEYIPYLNGALRGSQYYPEGIYGGSVAWNASYAHYQYMGELYLTKDGSSYAEKYEKKYPSGEKLEYHTPGTGANWFEEAKRVHGQQWIDLVKREAGKG